MNLKKGAQWLLWGILVPVTIVMFLCMTVLLLVVDPTQAVFAGMVQTLMFAWALGMMLYILEAFNIPAHFVVHERKALTSGNAVAIAAVLTIAVGFGVFLFMNFCWQLEIKLNIESINTTGFVEKDYQCNYNPAITQLICFISVVILLITPWPLPAWYHRKRFLINLLQSLGAIIGYHFWTDNLSLSHILITDTLTSASLLLWELEFSLCSFVFVDLDRDFGFDPEEATVCGDGSDNAIHIKPIVYVFPYVLRLLQCLFLATTKGKHEQYYNALKYLSSISVVASSTLLHWFPNHGFLFFVWISCCVVKTLYCFYWDLYAINKTSIIFTGIWFVSYSCIYVRSLRILSIILEFLPKFRVEITKYSPINDTFWCYETALCYNMLLTGA
eukprot:m.287744 g.287744  ORF g.287744 m.287744 type:complete len:387 (+) comp16365_c2_seq5:325-1485(+)